ncbi:hypothetical protein [Mesobacterium pallidum]|uniref:hypothetical protein n=1 Tax=Mesobacterium pallidum TaxID=2872037 RepID=UPI001EE243A0|nr:hypothetical protein [Mesobacterium pallidum]
MTHDDFVAFLEAISTPFINRDYAAWRRVTLIPFSMVTKDGPVALGTEEAMRRNFDNYLLACTALKLDQILRKPIRLEDCGDGTVIGTYETELLSRGHRATAPYVSSGLIHHTSEGYKLSSILNARGHHSWTGRDPKTEGTT